MKERKDIERFFQEKLKNLEATPSKKVWDNLEASLKKKKRKVVPFWWIGSGVASIILIALLLNKTPENKSNQINTTNENVVIEPLINDIKTDDNSINNVNDINGNVTETLKNFNNKTTNINSSIITNNKDYNLKEDITISEKVSFAKKEKNPENKINNDENLGLKEIEKKQNKINNNKVDKKIDLLEAIAKNDEEKADNKKNKNWSISPVFGIIGSNSFSKNSPIDENLNGTTKGNNSVSYGLKLSYKINNKWSLQSGIHLQEIQYSNNNIAIVTSVAATSNTNFNSGENLSFINTQNENFSASSLSLNRISLNGLLNQNYSYLEVPLEIKYSLFETKNFKTQIITGFSSLFLNKNEVEITSFYISTTGEATNLNKINFSGNFGFDFSYNFNNNWSLQLNPMFKTHLNTFSENSNGFKPYFLGIYSGINYQF